MTLIPWIGTSWKMNKLGADAKAFARTFSGSAYAQSEEVQLFVIPSFPYIADVAELMSTTRVRIGAQNMHWEESGAWTGEISAPMVKDCGATMVELGHSERRHHFGETDETVALKVKAALGHGLLALVCIGDTREEYCAGKSRQAVERQTRAALRHAGSASPGQVMLAYEPVWSIGEGGTPADPDFANDLHRHIKEVTADVTGAELTVLYGGSVSLANCRQLASRPQIDGLFIGRAAWDVAGYLAIIDAVMTSGRKE